MSLKKLKKWLEIHEKRLVLGGIAAYTVIFSAICIWKYSIFAYNGIDLAYFSQVFWNSLHGHFFIQTINPHLSLGDHAELVIPMLLPFYALFADPRTLLVLQSAALALGALPLHALASRRFGGDAIPSLFLVAAYLASPIIQNINLFEFHILPFALPVLFYALLAYEEENLPRFSALAVLALLVREDVSLVVAGVGLLAWSEKRHWKWRVVPVLLAAAGFFGSMRLIDHFAPGGSYKYAIYYGWLAAAWTNPLAIIRHFTTLANLEMFIGFGMPLLMLPYLRPRRLLLAAGPLAQILLSRPGGGELILDTHYATLFMPAIFLAAIEGLAAATEYVRELAPSVIAAAPTRRKLLYGTLGLAAIYGMLFMGPLPAVAGRIGDPDDLVRAEAARAVLGSIPADAPVAAGYSLLPNLSSRERLYSLHYAYLGVMQFGAGEYSIPSDVAYAAVDAEDFDAYRMQYENASWAAPHLAGGAARLAAFVGAPIATADGFYVFLKNASETGANADDPAYRQVGATPLYAAGKYDDAGKELAVAFSWRPGSLSENARADITIRDGNGRPIIERPLVLADVAAMLGKENKPELDLKLPLSKLPPGRYSFDVALETDTGSMTVSGLRSMVRAPLSRVTLGALQLDEFQIE